LVYQHLHFQGPIEIAVSNNAKFKVIHHGYQVENDLFWAGYGAGWEGAELRLWRTLAEGSHFIADIGANTGVYALAAAAVNPVARIVALEPVKQIYHKLVANIELNSFDIRAMQIAASDRDGEVEFFEPMSEHSYSASVDPSWAAENPNYARVRVPAARLDSLFDELGWPRIDLVKIDVEKHEPAVLLGSSRRLGKDKPVLLIEILTKDVGEAVSRILEPLDYRFFKIVSAGDLVETRNLGHAASCNALLCPAEWWSAHGERTRSAFA
jgi:FkbM family methyltransferase